MAAFWRDPILRASLLRGLDLCPFLDADGYELGPNLGDGLTSVSDSTIPTGRLVKYLQGFQKGHRSRQNES